MGATPKETQMSVTVDVVYEGDLECTLTHGPSGDQMQTDAPVDNRGRGAHFSPTDLVGAAMGSCTLTVMGIVARDRGWDMTGATAKVVKEMGAEPRRHISKLTVAITLPAALDEKARTILERTALTCPVQASMGERTQIALTFHYV
jgi:putative redox protein